MFLLLAIVGLATNLLSLSDSIRNGDTPIAYRLDAIVWHIVNIPQTNALELSLRDPGGAFSLRVCRPGTEQDIFPGDILSIVGEKDAHRSPIFFHTKPVAHKGHGRPPEPMPALANDILAGKHDHQLVQTSGLLRNLFVSELNPQWIWIVLKIGGQNLYAATPRSQADIDTLTAFLHRDVELLGIVLPQDGSLRHRVGRVLHFNGLADIHARARISSATAPIFALARDGRLSGLELGG